MLMPLNGMVCWFWWFPRYSAVVWAMCPPVNTCAFIMLSGDRGSSAHRVTVGREGGLLTKNSPNLALILTELVLDWTLDNLMPRPNPLMGKRSLVTVEGFFLWLC